MSRERLKPLCTHSVARALRALVTLARDMVSTRDWHRRLCANGGCQDHDIYRVTECPAGAACAIVMSGDITCRVPPLNTISGPYSGQSIAITSRSHLPSRAVLPPDPLRGPY